MNRESRKKITVNQILICIILSGSLIGNIAIATENNDSTGQNWELMNFNGKNHNYSPQNEINVTNVDQLEIDWIFPFPKADNIIKNEYIAETEGSMTPPLVVNGMIYVATNMRHVYAINATTGTMEWLNIWDFDWENALQNLPIVGGGLHVHGINYINGLLFPSNVACSIRAINATNGKTEFELKDICYQLEGNVYNWKEYRGEGLCGLQSNPPVIVESKNILIAGICGADSNWGGRSFIDGYDLNKNPPELLWRKFLQPPDKGDAAWALRECHKGWFFSYKAWKEEGRLGIPCSEVPTKNLINDWGVPKHYTSSVSETWGQIAVDEETGIIYLGTGNQGGWINQTYTPGPNLYASTIMALKAETGEILWWYQTVPRDMVQGDAAWNTILTEINYENQMKKAIIKFTTTGLAWALDAATGEPLWIFEAPFLEQRIDPDGVFRGRTAGHPCMGCEPNTQDGYWNDPMSYYDMQEKKWLNYPEEDWFYIIPLRAGEADISLDPITNTIFIPVSQGWDASAKAGPHEVIGKVPGSYRLNHPVQPKNTTIFAINQNDGSVKWSTFIDKVAFRGGIINSGGVVYVPSADGNLYLINSQDGKILKKINFGDPILVQPTIGKTADGESRIFIITGGKGRPEIGGISNVQVPGSILSLSIPSDFEKVENQDYINEENNIGVNSMIIGFLFALILCAILLFQRVIFVASKEQHTTSN